MKNVLIIGIGSRIMTDDAIGIKLVEDLGAIDTNPAIRYLPGETDIDYCIGEISGCDCVIIIDAFLSGKQPGEITIIPLAELRNYNPEGLYSMHGMHLLDIIRFDGQSSAGFIIGIEPYDISYGFTLSGPLQGRYFHILKEVQKHLADILNNVDV